MCPFDDYLLPLYDGSMKQIHSQKKGSAKAHDLAALEEKVDGLTETVNETREEVRGITKRLISLDANVSSMDARLDSVETRLSLMPTTADIRAMLSPLISDNRKIKVVIKEKLHVEV